MPTKNPKVDQLTSELSELQKKVDVEQKDFERVQNGNDYQTLLKRKEEVDLKSQDLAQKLIDMASDTLKSSGEYRATKTELMQELNKSGIREAGDFKVKVRVNKAVNAAALVKVLDGDAETVFGMAEIKQVTLNDFAKQHADDKKLKKEILDCIEETGSTVVDIC